MYDAPDRSSKIGGPSVADSGRTHVDELQQAINAVKALVSDIEHLHDMISGNDSARPEACPGPLPTPCLLDQLILAPAEIQRACEEGYKIIETISGFLRLR